MYMCPFSIYISCAALVCWLYKLCIQSSELLVPCGEDGFHYAPMNTTKRKVFSSFGAGFRGGMRVGYVCFFSFTNTLGLFHD